MARNFGDVSQACHGRRRRRLFRATELDLLMETRGRVYQFGASLRRNTSRIAALMKANKAHWSMDHKKISLEGEEEVWYF